MSNGTDCGCGPTQPGNQIIVPPGTHILQQPCPTTAPQSAAVPAGAAPLGQFTQFGPGGFPSGGGAGGQLPGSAIPSTGFLPMVARTFVASAIGQNGSFFADGAASWSLPGMIIYLPNQGQLEILGTSQNSITYRNRTVPPGTEILQGTAFAVGIPNPPVEIIDTGSGGGSTSGGDTPSSPTEQVYEEATQLSNIRGVLNGILSRIAPATNQVLVGRQGFWQRRQLGQMRYPSKALLINQVGNAQTRQWVVALPSKPSLPPEVSGFAVELDISMTAIRDGEGAQLQGRVLIDGALALRTMSTRGPDNNTTKFIHDLASDKTSITIRQERVTDQPGDLNTTIYLTAYYY